MAQPVVADGIVYIMDSDAVVSAFDIAGGGRVWRFDTKRRRDDSTNVGGGLALDQGTLYAVNGLAELVALDAAKGTMRWRSKFGAPDPVGADRRRGPAVRDHDRGPAACARCRRRAAALVPPGGQRHDQHARAAGAGLCRRPGGRRVRLRRTGDHARRQRQRRLDRQPGAASRGGSLADFSAIRGLPVIGDGRVYAIGIGGLTGRDRSAAPAGACGSARSAGEDSPWAAGDWLFVISLEQRMAAINRDDGRVAWVTELPRWENPEKQKDPITWYRPAAGRRPAGGGRHQPSGAGRQPLHRRNPRPAGAVRARPRWARSSPTAPCSW